MKAINYLLFVFLLSIACTSESEPVVVNNSNQVDSLQTEIKRLKALLDNQSKSRNPRMAEDRSFNSFLYRFMTDSLYQVKHVEFPIPYIHWKDHYPGSTIDTSIFTSDNWKHQWLYFNTYSEIPQVYDNFDMEMAQTNQRLLHFSGVETGTNAKFFFMFKDDKWALVKMENLGS